MRSMVRYILLVLFLWAAMAVPALALDQKEAEQLFYDAVKAYHAAHYDESVKLNEAVLLSGFWSSAVYYNLGNSYLKSGRLGKSIVSYARAARLAPRDGDLQANLSFVRSLVENYDPWTSRSIFVPAKKFFSAVELQWIGFGLFALTGIIFLAGLFMGLRQKRLILATVLCVAVSSYFSAAAVFQALSRSRDGVCVQRVDARFEPSSQATAYFKVPEGTEVKILREKGGWFKIERADSKTGWVPLSAVERI